MRVTFVLLLLAFLATTQAAAVRAIPDDNLAYPVLITLKNGSTGSGFFLNTSSSSYLVTARHVFFSEPSHDLLSPEADLLSYSRDPKEATANRFHLDLAALSKSGRILMHTTRDVLAIMVATVLPPTGNQSSHALQVIDGVTLVSAAPLGIIGVGLDNVKRYDDVLVGNDVVLFGYPTSLGLKSLPQLDPLRPLLRKGIVAGLNPVLKSIVLDCPAYPGNSGGPVLETESEGLGHKFRVVGVISQFVPNAEVWVNTTHGYSNTNISNSGYSIATPMDFVLELISP